ncbi:TPR-like protein [Heliocybe sulcata]|uniref:TPR-like protein n=1 Tax=Heliocybe sulcata TaxID=5364 RepID=A0A5C3N2J4_9AGAM|nr:TPR-like protein [Heliocybe sulcata]
MSSSEEHSSDEMTDTSDNDSSRFAPDESDEKLEDAVDASPSERPGTLNDGDFDRLVESLRQADVGTDTTGVLSKVWDFNAEEQDAEFKNDLRAASGIGRLKRKRGRRTGPVLSQQVKSLIGDGNQAYVDGDLQACIHAMLEVIRIEPRAASAWSVLAQCHEDMGDIRKALQLRIMAAHLLHDPELWERLAVQSKELGYNQQAIYCYRKLYNLDPTNVKALLDRTFIAKEIGDLRTARQSLLAVLKHIPHDLGVLKELRPILIELSDLSTCASLFQAAFDHSQLTFPSGYGVNLDSSASVSGAGFDLMDLFVLADLYNTSTLFQYEKAIQVIKRGCRWLQGRAEQKYWDMCEDDREYDIDPETLPGFAIVREGDLRPGMYPLDVNARHRLAIARIKMGDMDEGKMHATIILSENVMDYAPLFAEIADAYFEREIYAEARPVYEVLGADASTSSLHVLLQAAACRRMLGDLKEAAEVYQHVILADPLNTDAKMKLAEIYEVLNEPRKALDLADDGLPVIDHRRRMHRENRAGGEESMPMPSSSLFVEKSRGKARESTFKSKSGLSPAQVRALEEEKEKEVIRGYSRVRDLWPEIMVGNEVTAREWLLEAEKLVETFRETRNLFLTTRNNPFPGMFRQHRRSKRSDEANEEDMASRLQLELESERLSQKGRLSIANAFRGVTFDNWLRLFMQYAFLLTNRHQYALAEEVLRHILYSNAYQETSAQTTIRLSIITCATKARQYPAALEQCRRLMNVHQFNNEPLRLLCATLASGLRQTDSFIISTLQKHMLREMKIHDTAVKDREALRWGPVGRRYVLAPGGPNKGEEADDAAGDDVGDAIQNETEATPDTGPNRFLPTRHNPMLIGLYGQICCAAKSYQSAIFYLLHAYDYCSNEPLICLSLAVASLGRAMQRQADNRHHLVTQAMAFLSKYRTLRTEARPSRIDEVEYNFGRAFQQLGLHSHAVRQYERVLQLAGDKLGRDEDVGLAREAAYNLSLIYVTTGATPLAQELYRKWLSI